VKARDVRARPLRRAPSRSTCAVRIVRWSWIVGGGSARNRTMMRMLRERLEPASVEAADALGWSADAMEAQAFGFLAARGLKGLPLSYPATTGVPIR